LSTYVLHAAASLNDRVVEERALPRGTLQLGNSPVLGIPTPRGYPYLARITWESPRSVLVVDGRGRHYRVEPDADVEIVAGPVTVRLSLVLQFAMQRVESVSLASTSIWLTLFLLLSVSISSASVAYDKRCSWWPLWGTSEVFGLGWCDENKPSGGTVMGVDVTAEYLARLLNEDFAGDEQGVLTKSLERPDAEKKSRNIYMPAGNKGPLDRMGGAEDTSPTPIRTPDVEAVSSAKKSVEERLAPLFAEQGTPIDQLPEFLEPEDGLSDAGSVDAEDDSTLEAPAEEEEGWGIPDWYDEEDAAIEELEIDVMLKIAQRRLRIDPEDAQALNILSYYQYLAEDYDDAEKTYDRYIEIYPEDPSGYNNKALIYKRRGEYQREENLYRVALALDPTDVTAMNNLAVNASHQGRQDEALAIMRQLEVLDAGDAYAELHRSKIYAEVGNDDQALHYLRKALEGMQRLDTLHHIEFRQDIRLDPSFSTLRKTYAFRAMLDEYYGTDSPLQE
jgi:tetratricopeptide (TPR) repeat protein